MKGFNLLCILLTVAFTVLRLYGVIRWNWALVISPFLVCAAANILVAVIALVWFCRELRKPEQKKTDMLSSFKMPT